MNDADEIARAEAFGERLARRAIAMEGTCTGEHGVGQKKIAYLEVEHGPDDARPDAAGQGGVRSEEPVQPGQDFEVGAQRLTLLLVISICQRSASNGIHERQLEIGGSTASPSNTQLLQ